MSAHDHASSSVLTRRSVIGSRAVGGALIVAAAVAGGCLDEDVAVSIDQTTIWYPDADGDGFGDWKGFQTSPSQPEGYVDNNDDCNDARADVNPVATEVPLNGRDDDCSAGTSDDYPCGGGVCVWVGPAPCDDNQLCANNWEHHTPFCSVERALECPAVRAVRFVLGVYTEPLVVTTGGSSGTPLNFFANQGDEVEFIPAAGSNEALHINADFVEFHNVVFHTNGASQAIRIGEQSSGSPRQGIRISGSEFIHNGGSYAVNAWGLRASQFDHNTFSGGASGLNINCVRSPTVESYGNHVVNNRFSGQTAKGLFLGCATHNPWKDDPTPRIDLVANNEFDGTYIAIDSWFDGAEFRNNVFTDVTFGIEANGRNGIIDGNTFDNVGNPGDTFGDAILSRIETGVLIPQGIVEAVVSPGEFDLRRSSLPAFPKANGGVCPGPGATVANQSRYYGNIGRALAFKWGRCGGTGGACRADADCDTACGPGACSGTEWRVVDATGGWTLPVSDVAHVVLDSPFSSLTAGDVVEVHPVMHDNTISNNVINGADKDGIKTSWKTHYGFDGLLFDNYVIDGNYVANAARDHAGASGVAGINLAGLAGATVTNNTVIDSGAEGILIRYRSPFAAQAITITDNQADCAGRSGLRVNGFTAVDCPGGGLFVDDNVMRGATQGITGVPGPCKGPNNVDEVCTPSP